CLQCQMPIVSPTTPIPRDKSCFTMPYIIICRNNKPCFVQRQDHMQITSGMFTETMNDLNDSSRFADRCVYPAFNRFLFVKRCKTDLLNSHVILLLLSNAV